MKKLGTVKNIIHDGTILLSAAGQDIPPQGARVYDQRGAEIGKVARVFGPVNGPYISLKPKPNIETLGLLNSTLYLDPEERPAPKKIQTRGRNFSERGRRSAGPPRKKGVNTYRRKEKPRKK